MRGGYVGRFVLVCSILLTLASGEHGQEPVGETAPPPALSIVLFTNRPGVYDVAFHSLALQISDDYEVIVVDDGDPARRSHAMQLAKRLGINLQHIVRSKRKTSALSAKGGEANAVNTGLLLARGRAVTLLNDFTWLPPHF
eukprot:2910309-Rhodomonas_salina.1